MKATAEPSAPAAEITSTPSTLDRAEGVELLGDVHGSGYERGAALVRRADGQMVHLGPLMYALLECVDGRRTTGELATAMSERLGRRVGEEHVRRIAAKLSRQGLLAGTEHNAPPRRNPLLALRWKAIVTNPTWTRRLTAPFTVLFNPVVVAAVVAGFVVVTWFVLFDKGIASATSQAFNNPGLLLLVFVLGVASAGFHEFGHAAACRYGGATPGAMGVGIYLVWPAFYTDVTDAYRLPKRDRLRVDLGGLYFNAIVAVVTAAVWLACRADALLLLVGLQLLIMVKNLSPVIRSDGYHILADATGVPDLYAHIGPTLRRLIPGRPAEPSALTGRARLLVTLWVLVIVPVLLSLMLGAVLLLPRMATTAWDSGRAIAGGMPHAAAHGAVVTFFASLVRLLALLLPLIGSALITQRLARMAARKGHAWSEGHPARRAAVVGISALAATGAAWAWWPAGQYEPVRAADAATLVSFSHVIASPASYVRPSIGPTPPHLAPGTHLAVAMIPVGGATKAHPALYVIPGDGHHAAVALLSAATPASPTAAPVGTTTTAPTTTDETTTAPTTTTTTTTAPATTSSAATPPPSTSAVAFDFKLPAKPGPGDTQALAVNKTNGGVVYNVAYALVTVSGGAPVTNTNGAFAFASCKACTTVAVSFQVVLIVGRSAVIAPIDAAGSLNVNCPACLTTAIADQIVVTLTKQPSRQLVDEIESALKKLDALPALGAGGTPAAIAAQVGAVQQQVESALESSGSLAQPLTTTAATTTTTTPTTTAGTTTPTTTGPTTTTTPTTGTSTTPTTTAEPTTAPTTTTTSTTPTTTAETTTTSTTTQSTTTEPATTTTEPTTTTPTTTSGG